MGIHERYDRSYHIGSRTSPSEVEYTHDLDKKEKERESATERFKTHVTNPSFFFFFFALRFHTLLLSPKPLSPPLTSTSALRVQCQKLTDVSLS